MKLHRMTWREFEKHNHAAIGGGPSPDTVIPETYWFESKGKWYEVDKGYTGWNICDENGDDAGFVETLRELRSYDKF